MSIKRKIVQTYTPQGEPGFLGRGHIARPVIQRSFADSDPFILLMDDMLDKKDNEPVGGPHPHAGFETVTLLLEGELGRWCSQNERRRFPNDDSGQRCYSHGNN